MTILNLLNRIFNADQTPSNTVSWSGTNGLKGIQDDIAEEIRARGCIVVPTTIALSAQGKNNSQSALVLGVGLYTWQATGPANGDLIVSANDGGFWYLQATNGYIPTVTTTPNAKSNGVVLFYQGGLLKYVQPDTSVKTITVTP
jgi:hypothetical protein